VRIIQAACCVSLPIRLARRSGGGSISIKAKKYLRCSAQTTLAKMENEEVIIRGKIILVSSMKGEEENRSLKANETLKKREATAKKMKIGAGGYHHLCIEACAAAYLRKPAAGEMSGKSADRKAATKKALSYAAVSKASNMKKL
jgi:hypothetical protein